MEWRRYKYYAKSDKGYNISFVRVGAGTSYTAWAPNGDMLETYDDAEAARQCCQRHYDKEQDNG